MGVVHIAIDHALQMIPVLDCTGYMHDVFSSWRLISLPPFLTFLPSIGASIQTLVFTAFVCNIDSSHICLLHSFIHSYYL